jgi:ribose 5-phosphate isomerase B
MKIAIGSDEAGYQLKELVRKYLVDLDHEVEDFGTFDDRPVLYPDIAFAVAEQVAAGRFQRAILMCGTGIGMSICANKVPGVRAAQAHDTYSAERARKSNDAQVLAMGARVVGPELAKSIVKAWLESEFEPARSGPKVERITAYEARRVR